MQSADSAILKAPARLLAGLRGWVRDWPAWWAGLSPGRKAGPALLIAGYWAALAGLRGFRGDHLTLGATLLALSYGGRLLQPVLVFSLPYFLTVIIYDSQRFYSDFLRGPVHVIEPYLFDLTFFGIRSDGRVLTPNEWFQLHLHPALDLATGFAYLVFVAAYVAVGAYFTFVASRRGTPSVSAREIAAQAPRLGWGFLWVNLLGYSTYYWYAAAPPWYVSRYGLGPARMDAQASAAGCERFDELLGTRFFSEMYGRSADVFGAVPSLHVAYPLMAAYFAFRFGALRVSTSLFYLWMCFSAVYLNHHYILDILWGSAYALAVAVAVDAWCDRRRSPA
jgi:inositol phosphorylceramide synthase catalytic subunit